MKKAVYTKIAALLTTFSVLVSVTILPSFPFVNAKSAGQTADGTDREDPVRFSTSARMNAGNDLKGAGDDYELPFVPIETEHNWDDGVVTTPPTCTRPGVKTYTCKINANHTYTVEIPAVGHTPGEPQREEEVAATCTRAGSYDEVVYCTECPAEISRETFTIPIDADAHDFGNWVQTKAPTKTEPGEETRVCKNDPAHTETRVIPPLERKLTFLNDEVIIVVPNGAVPDGSEFDVQKIVPPPAEVVEKVNGQMGASSEVFAYYKIRLSNADSVWIDRLNGKITIKMKAPEQCAGSDGVCAFQEDETGKLIIMPSRWENDYLCYETDWLEICD